MHILIDLDGTLVDWGKKWDEVLEEFYPTHTEIPRAIDQRSFNLREGLSIEDSAIVDAIFNHPEFYRDLEELPGASQAIQEMLDDGHHVQIATSPWWDNPTCLQDKSDGIRKLFGADVLKRTILTSDKTILQADLLYDDKPEIKGIYTPTWSQILYDQPYNQEVDLPRLYNWSHWKNPVREIRLLQYDGVVNG